MIELNGEKLKRYELNRSFTVAPRHGNRLHEVRVQQSEATEPITVPTRKENSAIVADIPNIFMERYGTITVELVSIDKHGSKNSEKRSFVIHDNKKPDGYEYEENVSGGSVNTGGSANIDVTAAVGQTIVVEEVDANGKPTKWKAAEYQPRTHWTEEIVILPETTVEINPDMGVGLIPNEFTVEGGNKYTIKYNGVDYADCECVEIEGQPCFGNLGALDESFLPTKHPFVVVYTPIGEDDGGEPIFAWACIALDGSVNVTLSITEFKVTPIPIQYVGNAFPYYIEVSGSGTDDDPYVCNDAVANVEAIYNSGRNIILRHKVHADANNSAIQTNMYSLSCVSQSVGEGNSLSSYGCTFAFTYVLNPTRTSNSFTSDGLWLIPLENGTYQVSETLGD